MNEDEQSLWKQATLAHVFAAIAAHPPLNECLIFKGAQVLRRRLDGFRRGSVDIDATQRRPLSEELGSKDAVEAFLSKQFSTAVRTYFDAQAPVRFELVGVTVKPRPRGDHPRGWGGYEVRIRLRDALRPEVSQFPALGVDLAAAERLMHSSVEDLDVRGHRVDAYSVTRMAGEKLRAILQSLPAYREKLGVPRRAVRVKDVYDVAFMHSRKPISDVEFWSVVATEFREACRVRAVDCLGIESFSQDLLAMKSSYENDRTLPGDISFEDAWTVIERIVEFLEARGVVPFASPDE